MESIARADHNGAFQFRNIRYPPEDPGPIFSGRLRLRPPGHWKVYSAGARGDSLASATQIQNETNPNRLRAAAPHAVCSIRAQRVLVDAVT